MKALSRFQTWQSNKWQPSLSSCSMAMAYETRPAVTLIAEGEQRHHRRKCWRSPRFWHGHPLVSNWTWSSKLQVGHSSSCSILPFSSSSDLYRFTLFVFLVLLSFYSLQAPSSIFGPFSHDESQEHHHPQLRSQSIMGSFLQWP